MEKKKKLIINIISSVLAAIAVVLAIVLPLTLTKRGGGENVLPEKPAPKPPVVIPETEDWLVRDGASEYKILLPESPTQYVVNAAAELNTWLKAATGATLATVDSAEVNDEAKLISIGNTSALEVYGITPDRSALGRSGYSVYRKGSNIIIVDGAYDNFGVTQGVYDLLNKYIAFEVYGPDEIYYESHDSLKLLDYNVTSIPSLDYVCATNSDLIIDATYRMRLGLRNEHEFFSTIPGTAIWHNSTKYVNPDILGAAHPDWFNAAKTDVCLTAKDRSGEEYTGLVKHVADQIISALDKDASLHDFTFTQMDGNNFCACPACSKLAEDNGGSKSAVYMTFLNDVAEYVDAHYAEQNKTRDWTVFFFVYSYTFDAPLKEENGTLVPTGERCNKHVAPFICADTANWNESLGSDVNKAVAEMYDKWTLLSDRAAAWIYTTNFGDYLTPHNAFTHKQGSFKFLSGTNVEFVLDNLQSGQYTPTGFNRMGNYLEGKLARNADLDYDEYVDKFMKHYYGNAAATMKKLFNDTMTHFNYAVYELGMPNRKPVPSATYWPFAVVSGLRSLIDQALDDIDYLKELDSERYAVLRDRILLEGLAYDYLLIELHPAYYTEDQLLQMKLTFRETASRLNLTMRAEGILITDLYESWGI